MIETTRNETEKVIELSETQPITTGLKGTAVELKVAATLTEHGCLVYFPSGNNSKADLVIDCKGRLYRIQCKYSNVAVRDGQIDYAKFKTYSQLRDGTKVPYTKTDVDFFATIVDGKTYLVPIENITSLEQRLRFMRPKNGQTKNVTFAKDFELEDVLSRLDT